MMNEDLGDTMGDGSDAGFSVSAHMTGGMKEVPSHAVLWQSIVYVNVR